MNLELEELVILNLNTFKFNQLISYINDCTGLLSLLWFVAGFIMIVMVCCRAYYDFKQFFCYFLQNTGGNTGGLAASNPF